MASGGETEVFIPQDARVVTVPFCSLPSSITRKISPCLVHSERLAVFMSPVEVRDKAMTQRPRPLTPGQVLLPVVTSNRNTFRILREFLHSGEISLQVSDETAPAGYWFCSRRPSIVLFDQQIFLVVTKAKDLDRSLNPAPFRSEAPPLDSSVTTQDGGSDITEGGGKEDSCGAEDDGKGAEKRCSDGVMEGEKDDDITDRIRSESDAGAAEDHGKCLEVNEKRDVSAPDEADQDEADQDEADQDEEGPDEADQDEAGQDEAGQDEAGMDEAGMDEAGMDEAGMDEAGQDEADQDEADQDKADQDEAGQDEADQDECTDGGRIKEAGLRSGIPTGNAQGSAFHVESCAGEDERSSVKVKCRKRINFSASPVYANCRQDEAEVKGHSGESGVLPDGTETVGGPNEVAADAGVLPDASEDTARPPERDGNADVTTTAGKVRNLLEKCENLKRLINSCVLSPFTPPNGRLNSGGGVRTGTQMPIRDSDKHGTVVKTDPEPKCQVQNSVRDDDVITVDDDDDGDEEEICINADINRNIPEFGILDKEHAGNARDVEIFDASGSRRGADEHRDLPEKVGSRKRRVSGRNDNDDNIGTRKTADPSPKRLKAAAEDRVSSRNSEEASGSVIPGDVSGRCPDEGAVADQENLVSCGSTDDSDVTSPSELRISHVVSLLDPLPECRAADPELTDHHTRQDEGGVLLQPSSPGSSHELDYVVLKREENICRIRARLRGMEEKLDTLK